MQARSLSALRSFGPRARGHTSRLCRCARDRSELGDEAVDAFGDGVGRQRARRRSAASSPRSCQMPSPGSPPPCARGSAARRASEDSWPCSLSSGSRTRRPPPALSRSAQAWPVPATMSRIVASSRTWGSHYDRPTSRAPAAATWDATAGRSGSCPGSCSRHRTARRADHVTDAPTREAVGLGQREERDRVAGGAGDRARRKVRASS